jgi:hypothetical protein
MISSSGWGLDDVEEVLHIPSLVPVPPVLALGPGEDHTVVVTSNYSLVVSPDKQVKEFMFGETTNVVCAESGSSCDVSPLPFPESIVAVASSSYHSMALAGMMQTALFTETSDSGSVYTWGKRGSHLGTATYSLGPQKVPNLEGVIQIGSGYSHSLCKTRIVTYIPPLNPQKTAKSFS